MRESINYQSRSARFRFTRICNATLEQEYGVYGHALIALMAPIGEAYFPPLDRCLSGEHQLLSWKTTYVALSQTRLNSTSLQRHLTDPQTVSILIRCFSPFSPSTPQTKSSFETRTSAINVTPSSHPRFNIKEIKEDTLWLCKETNIDEISALRIAVIEWQTRPALQLLQGDGDNQTTLRDDGGESGKFGASLFDPGSSLLAKSTPRNGETSGFQEVGARHRRLLENYLSERRCILKCSEFITFMTLHSAGGPASHGQERLKWLRQIGADVLSAWNSGQLANCNHLVIDAVDTLRTRHKSMATGSGWFRDEGTQEDIELAWTRSQLLEMIHIMQITLNMIQSSSVLVKSPTILSWFRLMKESIFFESVQPQHPALQAMFAIALMSLPALISLAILNTPSALELLSQPLGTAVSSESAGDDDMYLLASATCNELNEILNDASSLKPASLAAMAWAIMMRELRESALSTREAREAKQSLRAADKYGVADSSDTDGAERPGKRSLSLSRRSSTGSDTSQQPSLLEDIYDAVIAVDEDSVASLARDAVGRGTVFEIISTIATEYCTPFGFEHDGKPGQNMRGVLLDLIRASIDVVDYLPPILSATLAVLTGSERYWEAFDRPVASHSAEPAALFIQDKVLTRKLFLVAMTHFPYESLPLLELCRGLAFANDGNSEGRPALWSMLANTNTFTCSLPSKDYQAYMPINTQAEADCIELTQDLIVPLIPEWGTSLKSQSFKALPATIESDPSSFHVIPSGTTGKLLNDSRPFVVAWNQSYSSLTYMGKMLYMASTSTNTSANLTSSVSAVTVGDIIGLITNTVSAVTKDVLFDQAIESAQQILGLASDGMDRNQDVISVVFDIFEKELYKTRKPAVDLESMEIIVQCIQFTFALLQVMPDRVWPFLSRSGLLGIGRDESQLVVVVATQEMVMGQFDFLIGCVRLFDSLVDDVVAHMVSRKAPTKAITRFNSVNVLATGVSQNTMEKVLYSFARTMIEVFEGTMKWKFLVQEDRMEINFRLCSTFQKILKCRFDINDKGDIQQKLTSTLAPAAEYIASVFLSRSGNDVTVLPLLHILDEGTLTRTTTLPIRGVQYWTAQVIAAIDFMSNLCQVNRLLQFPPSHLEDQIFKAATTLAKIYVAHESYKVPVINLLDILISSAADTSQQPQSLLGHLSPGISGHFLDVLSLLDQPLRSDDLSLALWSLSSTVVSKRQQWFAIFVLTGDTPRGSFKVKEKSELSTSEQSEPILSTALDALSNIGRIDPRKALRMLEFVALAADFWPWVLRSIEKHGHFLRAISEYAAHIGSTATTYKEQSYKASADYNSIQMASLVADILSMYTHYTQQVGNQKFAKGLVPHLTHLIKNAILPPSYNASLQVNLRKNFELKFPGCRLADFKRTSIRRNPLGDSFFYDLELADRMLSYEPAWAGRNGNDGFREELRRANFNLSAVESQMNLFHSWKSLLCELSRPLANEPKFQDIMAVAATNSLRANASNSLPEAIFEKLALSRAQLAFTLLQLLLEVKSTEVAVYDILSVAWDTARMYNPNFGAALGGADADYYRMLLKILYLALQVHTSPSPNLSKSHSDVANSPLTPELATQIALEIISTVVAQGFRSLTILLHENSAPVRPSDFALLTAILRSALHVPNVARNTTHLLNAFSDFQTARCASTLLSWSDQLATSGDPIYGELSVLFLLEISSVPSLAELLATEGVLSHILSTNLIRILRSRPFGPFDQPPRMYSIWTRAILPLLLNMLHSVGPPLAAEVTAGLNNFPHQLDRASGVFATTSSKDANADYITLSIVSEAVTLSLIVTILHTFREAGSSAAIVGSAIEEVKWDRVQVKEDVEAALQERGSLRERITPTNEREETWSRAKPTGEGSEAENKLEEKIVEEMRSVLGILEGNGE